MRAEKPFSWLSLSSQVESREAGTWWLQTSGSGQEATRKQQEPEALGSLGACVLLCFLMLQKCKHVWHPSNNSEEIKGRSHSHRGHWHQTLLPALCAHTQPSWHTGNSALCAPHAITWNTSKTVSLLKKWGMEVHGERVACVSDAKLAPWCIWIQILLSIRLGHFWENTNRNVRLKKNKTSGLYVQLSICKICIDLHLLEFTSFLQVLVCVINIETIAI